jgi:hypothetical protein
MGQAEDQGWRVCVREVEEVWSGLGVEEVLLEDVWCREGARSVGV